MVISAKKKQPTYFKGTQAVVRRRSKKRNQITPAVEVLSNVSDNALVAQKPEIMPALQSKQDNLAKELNSADNTKVKDSTIDSSQNDLKPITVQSVAPTPSVSTHNYEDVVASLRITYRLKTLASLFVALTFILLIVGGLVYWQYGAEIREQGLSAIKLTIFKEKLVNEVVIDSSNKTSSPESLESHYQSSQESKAAADQYAQSLNGRSGSTEEEAKAALDVVKYENAEASALGDIEAMVAAGLNTAGIEEIINQAKEAESQGDHEKAQNLYATAHGLAQEMLLVHQAGGF